VAAAPGQPLQPRCAEPRGRGIRVEQVHRHRTADEERSFYVSERKVYPRDVTGRFDRLRTAAVFWLLGMFYCIPVAALGRQAGGAVRPAGAQVPCLRPDLLAAGLPAAGAAADHRGVALFFFTALAGRLWCGYACPQTVWTETFLWMERWTEGDRSARMKLDAAPWSGNKLAAQGRQAHVVAGVRIVDRIHLRRLLHPDHGTRHAAGFV
jgi:hypothetical protein